MVRSGRPFLEVQLHALVMVNFEINPEGLLPHVPPGTELDAVRGRTFVSLVGFLFVRPRLWGIPVPFHGRFEQVNLRFYVVRRTGGDVRRGVVFLQEIVPRRWVALAARKIYGEKYTRLPMRHYVDLKPNGSGPAGTIEYGWQYQGRWNAIRVEARDEEVESRYGHETAFVTDRRWGYSLQSDGSRLEYAVERPPWRLRRATNVELTGDMARLWGSKIGEALARPPVFSLWIGDSPFSVHRGRRLPPSSRGIGHRVRQDTGRG